MKGAKEGPASEQSNSTKSSRQSQWESTRPRRVRDEIPRRLWAVALIGFWERAAFWGLTAPWQNYMQHPRPVAHGDTPGALGLGQALATRIYCAFYAFYYVTPLISATISDSYLGRYRTLLISVVLYSLGCAVMTVTSMPICLENGWGILGLIIAMVAIGLGGGGFQAVIGAFLADQQTEHQHRIKTLKSGEQVVVDRELTLQYIYNLYYWLGNVGSLSWFATVSLEKNIGFTCAYGLTLVFILVALLMLICGGKWYVKVPHEANALPDATRILLCAARNGFKLAHADPLYQLEHCHKTVSWSGKLVKELYRGLRACRVLLAFVVYYICFDQMQNNLISQASQMETFGIPNDMLPALNQVGCILFTPLVQVGLYPYLHKRGIYPKPITRIAIGFTFIALSMAYATVVQLLVYKSGPCFDFPGQCDAVESLNGPNHVNIWIQAPIYFFIATGEIFAYVTALEYAYSHAPKDMKAIVQAISLLLAGVGSSCALGLAAIARDPYLVIFYASLTGTMTFTTVAFCLLFRKYNDASPESDHAVSETGSAGSDRHTLQPGEHLRRQGLCGSTILTDMDHVDVEQASCLTKSSGNEQIERLQIRPALLSSTSTILVEDPSQTIVESTMSVGDRATPRPQTTPARTDTTYTNQITCERVQDPGTPALQAQLEDSPKAALQRENELDSESEPNDGIGDELDVCMRMADRPPPRSHSDGSSRQGVGTADEDLVTMRELGAVQLEPVTKCMDLAPVNLYMSTATGTVPSLVAHFEELSRTNSERLEGAAKLPSVVSAATRSQLLLNDIRTRIPSSSDAAVAPPCS